MKRLNKVASRGGLSLFKGNSANGALVLSNVHGAADIMPRILMDQLSDYQLAKGKRRAIPAQLHVTKFLDLGAFITHCEVVIAVEHDAEFCAGPIEEVCAKLITAN